MGGGGGIIKRHDRFHRHEARVSVVAATAPQ